MFWYFKNAFLVEFDNTFIMVDFFHSPVLNPRLNVFSFNYFKQHKNLVSYFCAILPLIWVRPSATA
ncbi:hypothetical protein IO90_07820 [Chryseobacterium sp. FH1]|nr:hypothetical protein IO90_07820 [Chryseobacterium sp. FH1]